MYNVRSCATILPPGADWERELADWHYCRTTEFPKLLAEADRPLRERALPGQPEYRA